MSLLTSNWPSQPKWKKEMHLYYFLLWPHPGWLLIKTFLELESVITAQDVRYKNSSPWAFWLLKNQTCSLYTWRTRSKVFCLFCAMPPIHLDCGFYSLSKAARDRGKDEKKNPLESQWQTSLSPTPLGGGWGLGVKKHKTNHKVFFILTQSRRHKCYCTAGVLASHSNISTQSTIFPKMTSLHSAE